MLNFKRLFLIPIILLSSCSNDGTSVKPIETVDIKLHFEATDFDVNKLLLDLNEKSEKEQESSRYLFNFSLGSADDYNVKFTALSPTAHNETHKELSPNIKKKIKEEEYIPAVKDYVVRTIDEYNTIPFDIYFWLLNYSEEYYTKDEISSMEKIMKIVEENNILFSITVLYVIDFLIDNEFININDAFKVDEEGNPLWGNPSYEPYFQAINNMVSTEKIDRKSIYQADIGNGDIWINYKLDRNYAYMFPPSINILGKNIYPYVADAFVRGFSINNECNLSQETIDALCELLINEDEEINIYNFPVYKKGYEKDIYKNIKDDVLNRVYLSYEEMENYNLIIDFAYYILLTPHGSEYSFTECYKNLFNEHIISHKQ